MTLKSKSRLASAFAWFALGCSCCTFGLTCYTHRKIAETHRLLDQLDQLEETRRQREAKGRVP